MLAKRTPRKERITPAHAGTRNQQEKPYPRTEDHPRTRGDKAGNIAIVVTATGSPPHTRGQGNPPWKRFSVMRITPAHAGTRNIWSNLGFLYQDHPRTRGDKTSARRSGVSLAGSPPHTRGQAVRFPILWAVYRITPAHAGTRAIYDVLGI